MSIKTAGLRAQEKVLLSLLSENLFNTEHSLDLTKVDIDALWCEAYSQGVSLTAFHKLNDEINYAKDHAFIKNHIIESMARNTEIDYEHIKLHELLKKEGIPHTFLKGFASSLYYPDPLMRSMGDVDFLVDTDYFEKAHSVLVNNEYTCADKSNNVHDVYFSKVCRCEMHFQPSGIPEGKAGVKVRKYLSGIIENSHEVQTELGQFIVPSVFHHGLIILLHMCHHLTSDGLGVRHLCDWAVFVASMSEKEFCNMFEGVLKDIGLWKFAQTMTLICIKHLGCPAADWALQADEKLADFVITDIFIGGNFGQKNDDRSHEGLLITSGNEKKKTMLGQLFSSANRIVYRNWKIAKRLKFLLPLGWLFFGGRYIIRSVLGKRPKIRPQKIAKEATERMDIYEQLKLFENG